MTAAHNVGVGASAGVGASDPARMYEVKVGIKRWTFPPESNPGYLGDEEGDD
jgi:hypothetical protein